MLRWLTLIGALLIVSGSAVFGQEATPSDTTVSRQDAIPIFLDCRFYCDRDYIREHIRYVNYVRDQEEAAVFILGTSERNASGGRAYTLTFQGRDTFEGLDDEVVYNTNQTDTRDSSREKLVRALSFGLFRYVSRSPLSDRISVGYDGDDSESSGWNQDEVRDKWNYWVFRARLNTYFDFEESSSSIYGFGSLSANRTTESFKTSIYAGSDYGVRRFDLTDEVLRSTSYNNTLSILAVKSLGDHWSAGGRIYVRQSTFQNRDASISISPTVEYNLWPYSESNRRELLFRYRVTPQYIDYMEETIFEKTAESLIEHALDISLDINEQWGSAEFSLEGEQYLHDFSEFSLELDAELDFRLFKGLSLNLETGVEFIRNQRSIPRRDATDEEILLERVQLATNWRYSARAGFSYTFGSIYNNVVNPRFGG